MQDTPRVMTASDISLGDVGVGISRGLQPREVPTPLPPSEMPYTVITLGESCYNLVFTWTFPTTTIALRMCARVSPGACWASLEETDVINCYM